MTHPALLPLLLATALVAGDSLAGTVYKSVDAEGRVRYSDQPPADGRILETIRLPDRAPATVPARGDLVEQMAATTARLKADRLAREADRAPPPRRAQTQAPESDGPEARYYHPLPYRHGYRPERRDHERPRREPDLRNERDRRRDEMDGSWYVPKRLPGR
ncbi:MAG: DUF4124 domain-containing protein [Porticoccaceae bacterium]|jgi:hypothetical protein|nr:DUF4124 domain-containing protein [Porticoccaceae bacterium]MEA3300743.1 DUF4124 domain-containing protein [Pseudomonadota bacterium]